MGKDITEVLVGLLVRGEFVVLDTPIEVVVIATVVVATGLLEADKDVELDTREPASLSDWVTAVEALSLFLVEDTWPKQQEEEFTETHYTFTACVIRVCSYTFR